jgi:hypothetical protein
MKKTLLRSLLIGAASIAPIAAIAGGVEVETCCKPPRVDIPDMREGWSFSIEGSALRGYNNNLTYSEFTSFFSETIGSTVFETEEAFVNDIAPNYAFGLRVSANYTLANSANVLKLFYEHLFRRSASDETAAIIPVSSSENVAVASEGSAREKLDGVTLLSEQHILIGPYWETTFSGGVRFAHVGQDLTASSAAALLSNLAPSDVIAERINSSMQFNGVGPMVGFGSMFHVWENIAIGGEAQAALLMGRNKIGFTEFLANSSTPIFAADPAAIVVNEDIDSIYSIVPEMYYRLYANYFYRFNNGSTMQVEAGWRANQFFNLRTFARGVVSAEGIAVNVTNSDDIGFSGPYLMLQYNL